MQIKRHQSPLPPPPTPTLTVQVVSERGGVEARVADVVQVGLVAGAAVGDDEVLGRNNQWADEDGHHGDGHQQQDEEGGAGVYVCSHQTHQQAEEQDGGGVEHREPVTLRQHAHTRRLQQR